ncbi:helix-turn-helix domain-containing protein [Xanthomonas sp. WHRI 10064A]|uniref:TetR/AcrR family transcriptional regulator n=1 Tax=unclassified Xanthomonas TaxID=2643310 RepID=UPI002B228DB6|nr:MULTISPECIES: helix-turn-helix domain-containing protein [unclassified Xanthomonas]MEA9587501.1 helix-turn-helix domain-containing protein [Xanthomonas sp. WHRI 10064B]MEA9615222.1 helix-turn-helix domain-containing protein [Xanthomonas sp. WHRI 10064A]
METALQLFLRHGYRKVSMSDIAQAAQMSRPSLYATFPNKEAIFAAQVVRQRDICAAATAQRVRDTQDLQTQLRQLFDIWVLEPVAAVIDSENGMDLVANCGVYAPDALDALYQQMEDTLVQLLRPHVRGNSAMSAADLAYILRLTTTSLKASADNEAVLRRLIAGLITMALSTVQAGSAQTPGKKKAVRGR